MNSTEVTKGAGWYIQITDYPGRKEEMPGIYHKITNVAPDIPVKRDVPPGL